MPGAKPGQWNEPQWNWSDPNKPHWSDPDVIGAKAEQFARWCGRGIRAHPVATFRVGALCLLAGAVALLRASSDLRALAAVALGVALVYAAFRFGRRSRVIEPPYVGPIAPRRHLTPAPEPIEKLAELEVGTTYGVAKPEPWTIPLWLPGVGSVNWLVVGIPRSGKTGFVWAIVHALAPWIRSGHVQLWGVCSKRGADLGRAASMFYWLDRFEEEAIEDKGRGAVRMMKALYQRLDRRYALMNEVGVDVWTPTTDEPLIVCWFDEVKLLATLPTKALRDEFLLYYAWLLSWGPAAGISILSCTQDPRKEVIDSRSQMAGRVLFHVYDETWCDIVLGKGARAKGATPEQISATTEQGVAFVWVDGTPAPIKVRSAHVDRGMVPQMNADFPAPQHVAVIEPEPDVEEPAKPVRRTRKAAS